MMFGFPRNLDLKYPNEALFTSHNNIEAITAKIEVLENIPDNSDVQEIVIIPLRSRDVNGKLVASGQGKENNVLDNGEKKKKSKKISHKKVKGSSMKKHPKQFNCDICGALIIGKEAKRNLQNHINAIHLKIKPFECEYCKKSFSVKGNMKTHVKRVHSIS